MSPIWALNVLLHTWHLQEGSGSDVLAARAFRAALFSCAAVFLTDSDDSAPLAIMLRQFERSWASDSQDSVLKPNALSEVLRESLYLFLGQPRERLPSWSSPYNSCFGSLESGIRATWPAHRSCAFCSRVWMLGRFVRLSTSVSGTLSCHFTLSSLLRQVVWKWLSCRACLL